MPQAHLLLAITRRNPQLHTLNQATLLRHLPEFMWQNNEQRSCLTAKENRLGMDGLDAQLIELQYLN